MTQRLRETEAPVGFDLPLGGDPRPIRLVTFDLYDTLIELDPPRWVRLAAACAACGLAVDPLTLRAADLAAEDYFTEENTRLPIRDRSAEEREAFRLRYTACFLAAAGLPTEPKLVRAVRQRYLAEFEADPPGGNYRVFPDVLPALARLRAAGIKRAVISNADADVTEFCRRLAFAHEMEAIITSAVAGWEKPDPRTFRAALDHPAIATPAEFTLHIGDQPRSDIAGAVGVGMRTVLLDRYDRHPDGAHPAVRVPGLLELAELVLAHNAVVG